MTTRLVRLLLASVVVGALAVGSIAVGQNLADAQSDMNIFVDDDGNVHEGNIQAIAIAGITTGCNPPVSDRFCPSGTVSRGQMAAFLVRALDLAATSEDYFSDDDGTLFEADINRLAASGITRGCNPPANTLYCPDGSVTRGQMAAFLVRALPLTEGADNDLFSDDGESVFEADINKLGTAGITAGCNPPANDLFCPNSTVKRDQMGSFLARAMKLDPVYPPTTTTTIPANPGDTVNCSDFDRWRDAQDWFEFYYPYYGDVARLDQNGDLIACESLPGAP